ncbi:NAD(P)/FAD-dependent oxidoreductase [Botrimarina hoheduenensis]|uniref:15-cis-phytoene desaturase n=1 Tax=Botrimarina hoheduenensis TaxID=2528000 RepID=A0A5C5WF39_9BACT|nr:NAD(P)/FAD-dependent oxidoreductase [Botrimarina hoheduenensis]TWT48709.1 15-cis-phytoene desaturase [Botrimarina hoheduenensis]
MSKTPTPLKRDAPHWAVVGGGMLGMTLAHELCKQGVRVTLLEAAPELGGLAAAWTLQDEETGRTVTWDRHYHVTLLSDTRLRALLEEIGLAEDMRWVETKTGFYSGGKMHSMSSTLEFLNFPPLTLIEKFRLGMTIFGASKIKNWSRLEKIPVADWLRKWSGRGAFEKIWLPLLKAKLGETYETTSAAFIWAHINRMYAARRSGMKKEMFGYVRGGYPRLLDRMAEVLRDNGVEIRTAAPVTSAYARPGGGVVVETDTQTLTFDNVAFTTPSPIIARAVGDLSADEQERHNGVSYLGIVCASLLLKKPITEYYVTNITDGWVPLTAVIEMTTIVDPAELGGRSLVYLPKYVPANDPLFERSDDELRAEWLAALEKMHPHFSREDVVAMRFSRVRSVMALPTLNYSQRLPPMATSVSGIFAVNSAQILKGNLNVNETIQVADEAIAGPLAAALRQQQTHITAEDRQLQSIGT